jgi:hypothetical protein
LSLRDRAKFRDLPASQHLTDRYLLVLAVARKGSLVTMDQSVVATVVPGGDRALLLIS